MKKGYQGKYGMKGLVKGGCGHSSQNLTESAGSFGLCLALVAMVLLGGCLI